MDILRLRNTGVVSTCHYYIGADSLGRYVGVHVSDQMKKFQFAALKRGGPTITV